jgi:threonylcarbamoyladenosine tRNA methylthiotransferase MtaB
MPICILVNCFSFNTRKDVTFAAMTPNKTVAFYTLGCKLNFSETSTIGRMFTANGFSKVDFLDGADIYVINTCSVTDHADKKCRKVVKQALKYNPNAFIAIIGCYAQLKPQEIASIPGVNIVLGANEKFNLLDHILNYNNQEGTQVFANEIKHVNNFVASFSMGDRTRTFLKVQDGCDYFCSFCTIPLARGRSRSDTIANTVLSAKEAASNGVKEIVLTGVNIGDFGKNNNETFFDLVKALDQINGIERIRISSIEPNLLTNEIITYVANSERFVAHFHIPLQSGSDKILKAMRRKYERELYADRVALIKDIMPDCCIGADVITGFPSETEEDFLDTYRFINQLDISYLHVFTYSERDDTTALRIKEVVPGNIRHQRTEMLKILSEKKKRFFYEQHQGKKMKVLFEMEHENGDMKGFTENYIKVKTAYDPLLYNEIIDVKLCDMDADGEMLIQLPMEIFV